ncbi:unnamed protein product, partial [Musa acuminata var. zebrina]
MIFVEPFRSMGHSPTSPFRVLTTTTDSMDLSCKAWSLKISAVESYDIDRCW